MVGEGGCVCDRLAPGFRDVPSPVAVRGTGPPGLGRMRPRSRGRGFGRADAIPVAQRRSGACSVLASLWCLAVLLCRQVARLVLPIFRHCLVINSPGQSCFLRLKNVGGSP